MFSVENLHVYYGAIHALHGVSFKVNQGEIISLIGANGAGKTTILHSISALLKPHSGTILFLDKEITGMSSEKIVRLGLTHVPEGRRIFANLSVRDNLFLGAYIRNNKAQIQSDLEKIYTRFPRLKERHHQLAGTLSGGEQQMLAMGRALMSKPRLLLLDEPSMGLAPLLVKEIFHIIQEIQQEGTTILLVEQNAHLALSISSRTYVLETGKIVLSGPSSQLAANDKVRKAYLGDD